MGLESFGIKLFRNQEEIIKRTHRYFRLPLISQVRYEVATYFKPQELCESIEYDLWADQEDRFDQDFQRFFARYQAKAAAEMDKGQRAKYARWVCATAVFALDRNLSGSQLDSQASLVCQESMRNISRRIILLSGRPSDIPYDQPIDEDWLRQLSMEAWDRGFRLNLQKELTRFVNNPPPAQTPE